MPRTLAAQMIALATLTLAACTPQTPDVSASANGTTSTPTAVHSAPSVAAPTPSPRRSPAPTAGPDQDMTTPPSRPAGLDGPATEVSAREVGIYFLELFPYALATGDLRDWDALSGKDCRYCAHLRAIITDVHDAGNHGTGGAYEFGFATAVERENGDFVVGIEYVETPSRTVTADGSVVEDFADRYSMKAVLELHWSGSAWAVEAGKATEFGAAS